MLFNMVFIFAFGMLYCYTTGYLIMQSTRVAIWLLKASAPNPCHLCLGSSLKGRSVTEQNNTLCLSRVLQRMHSLFFH